MFEEIIKFFSLPFYEGDPEKTQDATTTHRVSIVLLGLGFVSIPLILLLEAPTRQFAMAFTLIGLLLWLLAIYLTRNNMIAAAKTIILAVNTSNLYAVIFITGGFAQNTVFTLFFLLALANLLFPKRGAISYGIALLVLGLSLYGLAQIGLVPNSPSVSLIRPNFLIFTFVLIAMSSVLAISSANNQRNLENSRKNEEELLQRNAELDQLRSSLEERVSERTAQIETRTVQLEAIASVARSVASVQDTEVLLPTITRLVSEKFGFYHVGIFLVDDDHENAVLRAANSDGGRRMLARNHRLRLDTNSIVGYVTSRGEPRIALNVGVDTSYFDNPDLPNTRSEMALPLRIGSETIGALDVQSIEANAFSQEDVKILITLADQIAVAIENTRLFGRTTKALQEAERSFEVYIKQGWTAFSSQAENTGYHYDGNQVTPIHRSSKQQNREPLPQTGSLSLSKKEGKLTIPLKFRGQTIGVLDIKPKAEGRVWTPDDLTLLEAAAERAVLALENARLVESSQRRASRERIIGEISSNLGQSSDLNVIMQTAVEELGRKIGGIGEISFEIE